MCCLEVYVYLIFSLRCDIRYVVEDVIISKALKSPYLIEP
jgi:hypothetical protein